MDGSWASPGNSPCAAADQSATHRLASLHIGGKQTCPTDQSPDHPMDQPLVPTATTTRMAQSPRIGKIPSIRFDPFIQNPKTQKNIQKEKKKNSLSKKKKMFMHRASPTWTCIAPAFICSAAQEVTSKMRWNLRRSASYAEAGSTS